jgi:hypothetical protein
MNILFVPFAEGGIGHIIPLIALASRLKGSQHKTAFLLPIAFHTIVKRLGINVLGIDYSQSQGGFLKEIKAINAFNADIVVDDSSITTLFSTQLSKKPRVAIQRTGMFPGAIPRLRNTKYAFEEIIVINNYRAYKNNMGQPAIKCHTDFFAAEMKIVPGIKSVELLPEALQSDPTYVFCGPLLIDDFILEADLPVKKQNGAETSNDYQLLELFINRNKDRFKVLFTFGSVAFPDKPILNAVKYLLDNDVAVVTSNKIPDLKESHQELYFHARYLPMNFICSRVDLMIHHCGSGTYQYQILHRLPSITIGTKFQDREDVALRLEELNVNRHLPPPEDCEEFPVIFRETFETFGDPSGPLYRLAKRNLNDLKEETDRVSASFDFDSVLKQAVERFSC